MKRKGSRTAGRAREDKPRAALHCAVGVVRCWGLEPRPPPGRRTQLPPPHAATRSPCDRPPGCLDRVAGARDRCRHLDGPLPGSPRRASTLTRRHRHDVGRSTRRTGDGVGVPVVEIVAATVARRCWTTSRERTHARSGRSGIDHSTPPVSLRARAPRALGAPQCRLGGDGDVGLPFPPGVERLAGGKPAALPR